MVTVITVGNAECSRRCDAHCHEAGDLDCECVCNGLFHGRAYAPGGMAQAIAEASEDFLSSLRASKTENAQALLTYIAEFKSMQRQLWLFPELQSDPLPQSPPLPTPPQKNSDPGSEGRRGRENPN